MQLLAGTSSMPGGLLGNIKYQTQPHPLVAKSGMGIINSSAGVACYSNTEDQWPLVLWSESHKVWSLKASLVSGECQNHLTSYGLLKLERTQSQHHLNTAYRETHHVLYTSKWCFNRMCGLDPARV